MFNYKLTIEVSSEVKQLNTVVAQVYAQMSLIYSHQDYNADHLGRTNVIIDLLHFHARKTGIHLKKQAIKIEAKFVLFNIQWS